MNPEEIYIRQFKDCDLLGLTELLNDLENQELVGGSLEPMNEAEVLNWLSIKFLVSIYQDYFKAKVLVLLP